MQEFVHRVLTDVAPSPPESSFPVTGLSLSLICLAILLVLSEPLIFQYSFLRKGSCGWCSMYPADKTAPAWEKCSVDNFEVTCISVYFRCIALCFMKKVLCLPVTGLYTFGR